MLKVTTAGFHVFYFYQQYSRRTNKDNFIFYWQSSHHLRNWIVTATLYRSSTCTVSDYGHTLSNEVLDMKIKAVAIYDFTFLQSYLQVNK